MTTRGATVEVTCAACGATFTRRKSDTRRNTTGRFFCSRACQARVGAKPRRGEYKPCGFCGETFYSPPPSAQRPSAKFCSKACHDQDQRKRSIECACAVCGTAFRVSESKFRNRRGDSVALTCSRDCDGKRRITNGVGRFHNGREVIRWTGGYLYVWQPDHPKSIRNGWLAEHRHVMEQQLGRQLESTEHVHHINGKKWDNRPENLTVLGHSEHSRLTNQERLAEIAALRAELAEYRNRYGPLS